MDAVEFCKTVNRLCRNQDCNVCPVKGKGRCMVGFDDTSIRNIEETISKVEQWAKEHPIKTRQSEFLRMFPNAQIHDDVIWMCPKCIGCDYKPEENCNEIYCCDCKRKFWLTEVTDNGNVY